MKISILQENLSKALNHVVKAVSNRPNIPVLANVLIETTKGKIKISATNLEIGITAYLGADVQVEGAVTVSAKLLSEFINTLKSGKITLTQSGQKFVVNSVDNNAEFFIIPADDFPKVPESEDSPILKLNALEFADAISKVVVASSLDDSRPVLSGILFEKNDATLTLVGVDGFRLSKVDLTPETFDVENLKEVVPNKSLQEVEKIIRDVCSAKESIEIYMLGDKNQILFKIGDIELTSRLIEGEFPDYRQIIPSQKTNGFNVLKGEFRSSVKIAMIFARNVIGNKTKFTINPTDRKLTLEASVIDVGNNDSSVDISKVEGETFKTAYNVKFINDMLGTISGDEVVYETNGATSPGVFKDKDDKNYIHIIMPMRLE